MFDPLRLQVLESDRQAIEVPLEVGRQQGSKP